MKVYSRRRLPLEPDQRRPPIPWRRLWVLLQPSRRTLLGMAALTVGGSLIGLIPPLALGALVNDLAGGERDTQLLGWAALIGLAVVLEAGAYALADGLYATANASMFRDLRRLMFRGTLRRPPADAGEASGLASRFVSDAQTLEQLTVGALDLGAFGLFELGAALVVLGVLDAWAVLTAGILIVVSAALARLTQRPIASVAQARQEALESLSASLATTIAARLDAERADRRFRVASARVARTEIRLGWLTAACQRAASALAGLGPIAVVVIAAFQGNREAGTLLALYLLAERAFRGAEYLVDLSLNAELVRGAVARCFELVDGPRDSSPVAASRSEPQPD